MQPTAIALPTEEWAAQSADMIHRTVGLSLRLKGVCNVILTGGRSAERLYNAWAAIPDFQQISDVHFYFGDERCVPPDHPESNYGMVMRSLFDRGLPAGCSITRMEGEAADKDAAARRYAEKLPKRTDVLLLGVGEDGHIASLFPESDAVLEMDRSVMWIVGPKPPHERLTITPCVIRQATSVFILANGKEKADVLRRAMIAKTNYSECPAQLVLDAAWLLDTPLPEVAQQ